MKDTPWIIVDTETDGLYEPIHVVELSAQRMEGWRPVGEPFRMLLDHNVPIPPEATAIHGYTRQYLRMHGEKPTEVYAAFRSYAGQLPLVAHNLSYDWNRCLEPEWQRLGISQIGRRGFCSMMLARRLVTETKSYKLASLKECFNLTGLVSHRAKDDVLAVVSLFERVYSERLERAGLDTFEAVAAFTKKTPVAKCLEQVWSSARRPALHVANVDEWYYLVGNTMRGPFRAIEVCSMATLPSYQVWRRGMPDWQLNSACTEFMALAGKTAAPVAKRTVNREKQLPELMEVCRGIIADGVVSTAEVHFLNSWLEDAGCLNEWPGSEISSLVERILEDGVVTEGEKRELGTLLERITRTEAEAIEVSYGEPQSTGAEITVTIEEISTPYMIVDLEQGTPEWLEWRHNGIGASDAPVVLGESIWKSASILLEEKKGKVRQGFATPAMKLGTLLEPQARQRYIEITGREVRPVCVQSIDHDWLRASLDGLSLSGDAAVEIKCGESVYFEAAHTRAVPHYYYGQLQHILAVTGLPSIDFFCFWPRYEDILIQVQRDQAYIDRLLEAEQEFCDRVRGEGKRWAKPKSFTFSCPSCGQHISTTIDTVGISADCPTCGAPLVVPQYTT